MRTGARSVLVALAVLVTACGGFRSDVAATVNGEPIPLDRVERMVAAASDRPELAAASAEERVQTVADLQRRVLTDLIRRAVVDHAAADHGIEVSEEEIDRARQEQIQRAGGEEQADALNPGLTAAEIRERLATEVSERKLFEQVSEDVRVSDADVAAAYRQERDRFEMARASHILVDTADEANEILALLEGGAAFEDLARERSQDPGTAADGGSLGTAPRGSYVEPFDEALWSAQEGEVVGPVETRFGFHIIRVEEVQRTPLAEAAPQLREELRQQAAGERFQAFEQQLFAEADVVVAQRFGRYDPETATVVPDDEFAPAPPPQPEPAPSPSPAPS